MVWSQIVNLNLVFHQSEAVMVGLHTSQAIFGVLGYMTNY